ncbi:AAA family ATPase [Candidatus Pacearchaeota archaeon]|nr:AAA family ATPase [Candidatus Pacearchaeota archaeon]MBD3282802.1 AAA family ATPase [Candidatus Pacearchaeota archaeon]
MTYIKKLVMKGFKSFARETTIHLDRHMNVVVGPNGSGKSNITDALCFVLGRLSIKSIRAAKAAHLLFSGNKEFKPAPIAYVEMTLDNSEKTFALDNEEIIIRRIVKKNGQGVYKINNQTKTRQEVLELLGQAGIDPHGFNIVLQGEIERFVKMAHDERRKVIEEVAGISVYEMRKEKSLRELEKTDERLRQVNAVLRERTNYMRNLENEREQALRFKKLENTVKRCKASIINRNLQEKDKELKEILKKIEDKTNQINKKDSLILKINQEISSLGEKINNISKTIQQSAGVEQDSLNSEISLLKQEIAGLIARKENFENQLSELDRRKQNLDQSIKTSEKEIEEMTKEKGRDRKKELEDKKAKLDELDELKRKSYLLKSNLSSLNSQIDDKKNMINKMKNNSNIILNQIEQNEKEIKIKETLEKNKENLIILKQDIESNKNKISNLENELINKEKTTAIQSQIIQEAEKIKQQVSKLDTCPLCKTKITKEHIQHVISKSNSDIKKSREVIQKTEQKIKETKKILGELKNKINNQNKEISDREITIIKLQAIDDKKQQLKRNNQEIKSFESDLKNLESKKKYLENNLSKIKISEEQYENLQLEVNELKRSEERNLGIEITTKQRELERMRLALKQISRDKEEITGESEEISENLQEKEEIVEEKEEQADKLKTKYQKMFEHRNSLQDKIRALESNLMKEQNDKRIFENETNNLKIEKAQINAKKETLIQDLKEFPEVDFINIPVDKLRDRLNNAENTLARIGSVNLKALEVYDDIKKEYDKIKEKVEQLEREKSEILKIIEQIDKKKKKTFLATLKEINELFSRNFSELSEKGIVTLEPLNKQDPFAAGLGITVRVTGRKHFDVTSLSGGEQTIVALSLIFAIQEYRPYCFYIFDEIDAALDRRNSEKLAYLLKKHMKKGQYLIITHNDSIISESSNVLYGVSMQEGISKVISIEV